MNVRNSPASKAIAVAMALCFSVTAEAGFRQLSRTVTIDHTNRVAMGHLAGARASTDTTQQIGCIASVQDSGDRVNVFEWGLCYATTTAGVSVSCFTIQPQLIAAMRHLQGDAVLEFSFTAGGQCAEIRLTSASSLEPKR